MIVSGESANTWSGLWPPATTVPAGTSNSTGDCAKTEHDNKIKSSILESIIGRMKLRQNWSKLNRNYVGTLIQGSAELRVAINTFVLIYDVWMSIKSGELQRSPAVDFKSLSLVSHTGSDQ